METTFENYEKLLIAYLTRSVEAIAAQQQYEPEKPEGYEDFKQEQRKIFQEYELHLQMFIDYGADDHARREVGEPKEPDGYAAHQTLIEAHQIAKFIYYDYHSKCFNEAKDAYERHVIEEPIKPKGYDVYRKAQDKLLLKKQKVQANQNVAQKGINYDPEGIPEYLSADDHYNGRQNPEWVKKHLG